MKSFYGRLFEVYPSVKPKFKKSVHVQGRALTGMITAALSILHLPEELVPTLQKLAVVHTVRGIVATEYGVVGECLLWTFNLTLGDEFTEEAKIAWIRIYSFMISVMIPTALEEEEKLRQKQAS